MSDDRIYLTYVLECIVNIEDLAKKGRVAIENARHDRAALLYYLQTMAETTQRISDDLKSKHDEVDWVAISGFRNRLVHGYLEVNMAIVWNVIENYLPGLKHAISALLKDLGDTGTPLASETDK